MASSSFSSSSQSYNYAVFLSFRGEDTRTNFVDHLYSALVDRNIPTYKDDVTLPRGEVIRPALLKAIEGSQIAVIIFSKNYADSSWCLDELAFIMQCMVLRGLNVIPVFYDVTPSEVRKQEGDFRKGFAKQKARNSAEKIVTWRRALVDASEISGWETKNIANGHEAKIIKEIADTVSEKFFLINSGFGVDENLVGMSARLQGLEAQLHIGSDDVRMVGIWGVGGSGKTTLASSLYMKISRHFQGGCIIENIREKSSRRDGLEALQEHILSQLSNTQMKLHSVELGKQMIRSRLNRSNVLIVLDDVDDRKQLDALAGSHNWFGSGSRIIITTRDEHLLKTHKVDGVCSVTLLSHEEAVMLFKKHAYNQENLVNDYETLSSQIVSYAAGLPLALKVLGSFLYDKDEKEWMSAIARLKNFPETEIIEKLKISYDGLKTMEKELFLEIACFFRGIDIDYAMEIFEACGYDPIIGIKVLRQKALISIDQKGQFDMHDLVQEMGHYIVRGEHPHDPSKHSRVWESEDIENMFLSDATTENDKIEALEYCNFHTHHLSLFYENISRMKKLRYLDVACDFADKNAGGPTCLSDELRFINWECYPKSSFPDTFKPVKLVILKLSESSQTKLWKGYKHLPRLKVLELSFMKNLLSTPDFDGLPCLQKLSLFHCNLLEKIHPSLGKHTSIEHVCVDHCERLRMFPPIICMGKLKTLKITSCDRRLKFPEIKSNMESLVKLSLEGTGIDALPSFACCANLISLHLSHCYYTMSTPVNFYKLQHLEEFVLSFLSLSYTRLPFELSQLPCNLRKLSLRSCRLTDGELPSGIGLMSDLEELDLSYNKFTRLDFNLSQFTRLKILKIENTSLEIPLEEFPMLPSSLIVLSANRCSKSLTTIRDSFTNCKWLCDVSLKKVRIISGCNNILESMLQGKAVENHYTRLILEGTEIAKVFRPPLVRNVRIGCRLELPKNWCSDFSGFLMCIVLISNGAKDLNYVTIKQVTSGMESEDSGVESEDSGVVSKQSGVKSEDEDEDEDAWKARDENDEDTLVWYVSFASLRHTEWWNSKDKTVPLSLKITPFTLCSGFGVRMVARKSRSGPSTPQEEPEFSRYTPKIDIYADSKYLLQFRLRSSYDH